MFPVRTTARFDVNIRRITQNLYFSGIEDPDQGLKTSLVAALVNVRTFPEAYPRTGKARYPLRPFGANGTLAERVIGRSVPSRLCSRRNTA